MIVRDEEANLPACLESCADLFDEIVIVDTGSTDRTREIAAAARDKHGGPAKVFDFPWCDDFAAARNESLRHATGDWVFWLDADEQIGKSVRPQLSHLFAQLEIRAPSVYCLLTASARSIRSKEQRIDCDEPFFRARLAPRFACCWSGRLHEQMDYTLPGQQVEITILHTGYLTGLDSSFIRNLRISKKWVADCPDSAAAHLSLAQTMISAGDWSAAKMWFREAMCRVTRHTNPSLWLDVVGHFGFAAARAGDLESCQIAMAELKSFNWSAADGILRQLECALAKNESSPL